MGSTCSTGDIGPTSNQSLNFSSINTTTIKESKINAQLNSFTDKTQIYTFGSSIPPMAVAEVCFIKFNFVLNFKYRK